MKPQYYTFNIKEHKKVFNKGRYEIGVHSKSSIVRKACIHHVQCTHHSSRQE